MNNIPSLQNELANIRLLRARQELFNRAKFVFLVQLLLTVALPVAGAVFALSNEAARPAIAVLSLLVTLLDIAVLDRLQRRDVCNAAKVAEQFDCSVLGLPWNNLSAGRPLEAETVEAAASAWAKRHGDAKLRDWYPPEVGQTDISRARLLCHRSNIWYDATLRQLNSSIVLLISWTIPTGLALACWVTDVPFREVALVFAPAAPVLVWSVREHFRQKDTAEGQDQTKREVESVLSHIEAAAITEEEASRLARDVQNALYVRRVSSPLTIPGLYELRRAPLERQMKAAIRDRLGKRSVH